MAQKKKVHKGDENLILLTKGSERARELGRKGGQAYSEKCKKRRLLRERLETMLLMNDANGNPYADAITVAIIKSALDGDTKAYEVIRDTIGEKPTTEVEATIETPTFIDDLDKNEN